jgi:hypothetical protein
MKKFMLFVMLVTLPVTAWAGPPHKPIYPPKPLPTIVKPKLPTLPPIGLTNIIVVPEVIAPQTFYLNISNSGPWSSGGDVTYQVNGTTYTTGAGNTGNFWTGYSSFNVQFDKRSGALAKRAGSRWG